MAVSQVGHIIKLALQELEVLPAGDNPNSDEYTDAVDWLNVMLSGWEADESKSMRPNLLAGSFNTVSGTAAYTCVASTGTAFLYRPIAIVNAYSSQGGVDRPLSVLGKADYNAITNKTLAGSPSILYYIPAQTGAISFDRVPDGVYAITCDMQVPVGDYADQNTVLGVSPEYRAAMVYNLAVTLAPSYKANLRPQTAANAKRTLESIQYQAHIAQRVQPVPSAGLIV